MSTAAPPLLVERRARSPTRRRRSCATTGAARRWSSSQPIMMFLLFGFGAVEQAGATCPGRCSTRADDRASRRLVAEIQATGYFLPPQHVTSYADGRELLLARRRAGGARDPDDFRRDVERGRPEVQLLLDGSDPLSAARVGGYVAQVGARFDVAPATSRGGAPRRTPARPRAADRCPPALLVQPDARATATSSSPRSPACCSPTSACRRPSLGLVGERESGTYEQMLALPTTALEIVLGKLVPYVVVSYVRVAVRDARAPGLVFGFWPQGSWLALLLVTLPFVLASLGHRACFVSALARTSAQAVFITVFFIMPSFVLSGVDVPVPVHAARRARDRRRSSRCAGTRSRCAASSSAAPASTDVARADGRAGRALPAAARARPLAHEAAAGLTPVTSRGDRRWTRAARKGREGR